MGDVVTVSSDVIRDQKYGAGGAFLDGSVSVSGQGWRDTTMVAQLVPIIPHGTEALIVPDGSWRQYTAPLTHARRFLGSDGSRTSKLGASSSVRCIRTTKSQSASLSAKKLVALQTALRVGWTSTRLPSME